MLTRSSRGGEYFLVPSKFGPLDPCGLRAPCATSLPRSPCWLRTYGVRRPDDALSCLKLFLSVRQGFVDQAYQTFSCCCRGVRSICPHRLARTCRGSHCPCRCSQLVCGCSRRRSCRYCFTCVSPATAFFASPSLHRYRRGWTQSRRPRSCAPGSRCSTPCDATTTRPSSPPWSP